ncbi:hypothetical protein ACFY3J_14890 [Streptomyces sp. NPDC001231]|uniref:hypothetical protein n=1 Tax=Streptomyces sp. NPDC001231 TaxID=3364549 RepID=UPI00369F4046
MAIAERSGPPTLIVRSPDAVARLTAEGVVWEEGATVTRIPYLAVVDATVEAVGGRRFRLRVEVADRARGRSGGYELECGVRAAQTFVCALLAHRAVLPATGAIPAVTTERRTSAPLSRYTRGELGLRVLLVAVVLNFLALVASGRYLAAVLSCFGFFAWWGCADLAAHIFSLARPAWLSIARGVQVEAHYVRSDLRHSTSGRMWHMWVYEYTDLDGGVHEYVTGSSSRTAQPPRTRTVTIVPGTKDSARSRADAVLTLLIVLPALLLGLVIVSIAAVVAMPGVLLLGLG